MLLDNTLVFDNYAAVNFTTATASTNVIDLQGGINFNYGNATRFGEDLGIGQGEAWPQVAAYVGLVMTSTASATLNIQFQGSTDSTNWDTYMESGTIAVAKLVAGQKVGAWQWPHRGPSASLPRYIRLNYVPSVGAISTGTIFAAITLVRDDWTQALYPANYTVGA